MATESLESRWATEKPLYLRMTPEIMAELAFQNANLLTSRLSASHRREFWNRLARYATQMINESDESRHENSPA